MPRLSLERPPRLARAEAIYFERNLNTIKYMVEERVGSIGLDIMQVLLDRIGEGEHSEASFPHYHPGSTSDKSAPDALALLEINQMIPYAGNGIRMRMYIPSDELSAKQEMSLPNRVVVRADHGHNRSKNWVNLELWRESQATKTMWHLNAALNRDQNANTPSACYGREMNDFLLGFYHELEAYLATSEA